MLGLFEIRHQQADPHGRPVREKRLQRVARAVEFTGFEPGAGDREASLGATLGQPRQRLGPLEAVEAGIARAQVEIDLGQIRVGLHPPRRLDDLGGAPQVALRDRSRPASAAAGTRSGASLTASERYRKRPIGIMLGTIKRVGCHQHGPVTFRRRLVDKPERSATFDSLQRAAPVWSEQALRGLRRSPR